MASTAQRPQRQQYTGAVGTTRTTRTTVLCGGCSTWYGGRYYLSIDVSATPGVVDALLDGGFAGINAMACPACDATHIAEEAVVVHDPTKQRFVVVVPEGQRHRIQQHKADLIHAVAAEPGVVVPAYALEPAFVVGASGLAAALGRPTAAAAPEARETEPDPPAASSVSIDISMDVDDDPTGPVRVASPLARAAEKPASRPEPPPRAPSPPSPSTPAHLPPVPVPPVPSPLHLERGSGPRSAPTGPTPRPPTVRPSEPVVKVARGAPPVPKAAAPVMAPVRTPSPRQTPSPAPPEAGVDRLGSGLLAEVLGARTEPSIPREPPAPARERSTSEPPPMSSAPTPGSSVEGWDAALDEGWSLDTVPPSTEEVENDPTHVVRVDEISGPPRAAGPEFDAERAAESGGYLDLEDGRVVANLQLTEPRAQAFEDGDTAVWFQLHVPPAGPVPGLLLLRFDADRGEVADQAFWVIDPTRAGEPALLDALERDFEVTAQFYDGDGRFLGRRRCRSPLERNVASGRAAIDEITRSRGKSLDIVEARREVTGPDYDRLGRLKHNFNEHSFESIATASAGRLALGILSYWSAPERRDYLLRVKAFPEPWYERMTHRVLSAALEFGLAMDPHLRQRAIELGLAPSSAALVTLSLANFAEVNLNLKPNDLDPLDAWDNWEALLALAEELDIRVDADIEELASLAMQRARAAAQADPIDVADDESVEMEEVADLGDLGTEDLVGLLNDRGHRVEAVLTLLNKGESVYAASVFDAIKGMSRDELLRVVPAALAMGPTFESFFLTGLQSRRASLRLGSALFLAEIRSERAVAPLLALLPDAAAAEWPILARAAARMGRRILNAAVDQIGAEGDEGERVSFALALLGAEARGALSAAFDKASEPDVRASLRRAIDSTGEVSFGDAADFAERLADAFTAAGPDSVGPDFEEDLESVDLGPAASMKDPETDVDLDGLDEPRGGK